MDSRKITMRELANHLGVSVSTVSRALNPDTSGLISAQEVARIQKAAEKLGYVQNIMASSLKKGVSKTIGVIIPDLMNPAFPPILKGVMNSLNRESYTPIISYCENDINLALAEIKRMKSRQVDGFILAGAFREDASVSYCIEQKFATVTVGRSLDEHLIDQIIIDNGAGTSDLVSHLVSQGHKKIAFIAGPQNISDGYQRFEAFKNVLKGHRITLDKNLTVFAEAFNERSGKQAVEQLIARKKKFTAIVTSNDLLALGCIEAIEQAGLQCPKDVSVVGWNNMPYLDYFKVPLTTVDIPFLKMGEKAGEVILERIKRPEKPIKSIIFQPTLLKRRSTASI